MFATKHLRFILPGCALLLVLFGVVLFLLKRNAAGSEKGQVRIRLVQSLNNGNALDCKWRISGNRKWETFSSVTGSGPASRISLEAGKSPSFGLVRAPGSDRLEYELKVSLGASNAPGQTSYTISRDMHGPNGAAPSYSSSSSFSSPASSLDSLVVVNPARETLVKLPGSVQLATVDGKPIILEFGK